MRWESFPHRTRSCLKEAGWRPRRRVSLEAIISDLKSQGYEPPTAVVEFLGSFGGLLLIYPHYKVPTALDQCHFDAAGAARGVFRGLVSEWAARVGSELCPIGQAFHDHMTLTMTETGSVYAGFDDTLSFVAPSGIKAVEALCEGYPLHEVSP